MNLIELTQKLISIPSYVDENTNEYEIGNFIYDYVLANLPWLDVKKQMVEDKRFNVIALPKNSQPKLLFVSHMDTVKPTGIPKKQLKPQIIGKKLYGLGSADMKSGLAASIKALEKTGPNNNIGLIFDIDEEYYFKGANKLVSEYNLKPDLVICPEPTDLTIINGCRGVIEIEFEIRGKTGHASRPSSGINAIKTGLKFAKVLEEKIKKYDLDSIGTSSLNVATITGGVYNESAPQKFVIQANAIPDYAKILIDIRPAFDISAGEIIEISKKIIKNLNANLINYSINLDLQGFYSDIKNLKDYLPSDIKTVEKLDQVGFYEAAILSNAWGVSTISLGPTGKGHIENESVDIDSVNTTYSMFKEIIDKFSS